MKYGIAGGCAGDFPAAGHRFGCDRISAFTDGGKPALVVLTGRLNTRRRTALFFEAYELYPG